MKIANHAAYLRVADMQRSPAFYRDGLGFTVLAESSGEDGLFWASLEKDDFGLMISHRPSRIFPHSHEAHEHDEYGGHIFQGPEAVHEGELNQVTYVYVEDVDAVYSELESRGLEPCEAPQDRFYGVREFLLRDPDVYYYAFARLLSA